MAFLSIANIPRLIHKKKYNFAFFFSSLSIAMLLMIVAIELYPVIIISTGNPAFSITVYNGAASEKTLGILLIIASIGTPLVVTYTTFVFWTFRGKVKMDELSYWWIIYASSLWLAVSLS